MECKGIISQPLGNDVLGALMAQIDAFAQDMKSDNDAFWSDMDILWEI